MRVGVIGAGIGGLCAAIGMQRGGAEVTVLERSADLRPGGSGLSVFANGVRALDEIGVGAAFRDVAAEAGSLRAGQRRPDGSWLATLPAQEAAALRVVDRAALHGLLVDALVPGTLRPGSRVTSTRSDGTVVVRGADGAERTHRYDVVVAADGLRSPVRRSWPGDPGVRYAGYAAWRAITDRPVDLRGEAGETWGSSGLRFGMAPLADGRVYWFAVATRPARAAREGAHAGEHDEVRRLVGGWHAPIPALLDETSAAGVRRLPVEELAGRLRSFRRGRVVLLGDAAHAMTPNLGQGGGQAMEDAATLAVLLRDVAARDAPDAAVLDAALARYDALRRPRAQRVARRSRAVGRLAHARGPAARRARDLAVRLTPDGVLVAQARAVQRWAPPSVP